MVHRKILNHKWPIIISLMVFSALYYWLQVKHNQIANVQFILGWVLSAVAVFMSSYKLRKKLSVLPLGKVKVWHMLHIYGGIWVVILFVLHAGLSWPSNPINQALWLGTVVILMSGFIGLILTKFLTPLVSSGGERLIFDRIPGHISIIREKSQKIVLDAAGSVAGKPLVDYYNRYLHKVFNHSGQLGLKLFYHKKRLEKHRNELKEINRYLDSENSQRLVNLDKLLVQKYVMDWQYSTLSILRRWTLMHVPVIWFCLVILLVHIMIQYAFEIKALW